MSKIAPVNFRSFKQKVRHHKSIYKRFLTKLEKNPPVNLDKLTPVVEKEVWKEVDCLSCANCCKTMTPTYTLKDIKRIAVHLDMSVDAFKKKWLLKERGSEGDWINKSTPCQFLNLKNNKCSIYEVRPVDCSGFPHLSRKRMVDYMHIHKQNIEYCPATYKMVEKM
ncbi:MAG: YkgJ family cysteine cluster protein, partial [Bacteroidia bacterium]|nr:YkgJ family cysteine cluster protein [Bacteroidia bacterium]